MNKIFIDTNLWLYAFIESQNKVKCNISRQLIKNYKEQISISYQVINEVSYNLIRKANFDGNELEKLIKSFLCKYTVLEFNPNIILHASCLREKINVSFWDSLIISTALNNQCNVLYSEDMHHKQLIENKLTIINPFI